MQRLRYLVGLAAAILLASCGESDNEPSTASCQPKLSPGQAIHVATEVRFDLDHRPGELLVLGDQRLELSKVAQRLGARELGQVSGGSLYRVSGPLEAAAAEFQRAGATLVQPNYLYRLEQAPNDSLYNDQRSTAMQMGLEAAWDIEDGTSCPPRIAVLDDGIDANHPDLVGVLRLDFADLDVADRDSDPSHGPLGGHGTQVAGLAAAQSQNQEGIAGVTWGGQVIPIKVFGDDGVGTSAAVARGVERARELDAQIINLSLCLTDTNGQCSAAIDPAIERQLERARSEGRLVVAAAGNTHGPVSYPGTSPNVLPVGSVNLAGQVSTFSARGEGVSLYAPGGNTTEGDAMTEGILTTEAYGGYRQVAGTSFSSALVAGGAALIYSQFAGQTGNWPAPDLVIECLLNTSEPFEQNAGRVRFDQALACPQTES